MSAPNLIGLTSATPGCGKSTSALWLMSHGYQVLPMAGTLKAMAAVLLQDLGAPISNPHSDGIDWIQEHKDTWLSELQPAMGYPDSTVRWVLQSLGTDWGRNLINPSLWIEVWRAKARRLLDQGQKLVCDDVRFRNEAQLIRSLGGVIWRIERPHHDIDDTVISHASEGELNGEPVDAILVNGGSISELSCCITEMLEQWDEH